MYLLLIAPSSSSMGCGISKFEQEVITTTYESNDNHRDQDHVDHHRPISSTSKLKDYGRNEDNIDDYRARDGHKKYSSSNTKEEVESMQEREVKGCSNSNDFDGMKEKDRLLEKKQVANNNNRREVEKDRQKDEGEEEEGQQLYDREDSLCFPGSPSFRDYCILDDEYHSKINCKKGNIIVDAENKKNKSQLKFVGPPDGDKVITINQPSGAGPGAQQVLVKKASKVRRFRDAMSSRSPRQGRKTTLKVSSNKAPKKLGGKAA